MDVLTFQNADIRKKLMITSKHVMKFYSMLLPFYNSIKVKIKKFKRLQCEGIFIMTNQVLKNLKSSLTLSFKKLSI